MTLMAAALLASCSDDTDYSGDYGQIRVPDTRQMKQTVSAGDTQAAQGVTFTTEGAWTSTITQTRTEAPDWITVSPDHGDAAGSYTLKITLKPNTSRKARTAKIVISCGTSKIEITVTQEGTDAPITPTPDSRISKIECYYEEEEHPEKKRQIGNYYFEYDNQNRITEYRYEDLENPSYNSEQTITFSYPDSKTLKIKYPSGTGDQSFTITLNDSGYATEISRDGGTERWTVSYDSNGRCIECRQTGTDGSTSCPRSTFDWANGNLVAFTSFKENGDKAPEYCYEIAYEPDQPNRSTAMSLDLNALLFNVNPGFISEYDPIGILLATINRLGVRSANLTKTNLIDEEFEVEYDTETNTRYYYEILPENQFIQWSQESEDRVTGVRCISRLLYLKETPDGEKTAISDKCYTRLEIYNILY